MPNSTRAILARANAQPEPKASIAHAKTRRQLEMLKKRRVKERSGGNRRWLRIRLPASTGLTQVNIGVLCRARRASQTAAKSVVSCSSQGGAIWKTWYGIPFRQLPVIPGRTKVADSIGHCNTSSNTSAGVLNRKVFLGRESNLARLFLKAHSPLGAEHSRVSAVPGHRLKRDCASGRRRARTPAATCATDSHGSRVHGQSTP
jgi:hypothetical protein